MQTSTLSIERAHRRQPLSVGASATPSIPRMAYQNHLLRELPKDMLERISSHLELVEMPRGTVLYETGSLIRHAYFPVTAIVSLLYMMANGATAQTAMVGFEGMVGISPLMGCQRSLSGAVIQRAGFVIKVHSSLLASEFERSPQATHLLLRYTQSLFVQLTQSVVCNRHHSVEDQLCRWLLTTLDRQNGNEILMTHELIANLIGARREGVTEAAGNLQRLGIIKYRRGEITVLDRPALERHVCECYELVSYETDLLIPG